MKITELIEALNKSNKTIASLKGININFDGFDELFKLAKNDLENFEERLSIKLPHNHPYSIAISTALPSRKSEIKEKVRIFEEAISPFLNESNWDKKDGGLLQDLNQWKSNLEYIKNMADKLDIK